MITYANLKKDYETTTTAEERGLKEHEELMKVLKSTEYEGLQRIAINPLLLTIIAIVHRSKAKLPKERHTLYRQALEVLIDLRNKHNKRIAVYFSVDNSLANLAKIAVFLMQKNRRELSLDELQGILPATLMQVNRRELSLDELQSILPATIEGKTQTEFLKEMVLKAGLLFYSDGKYGFLHKTFQEYLAAYYYQQQENPNTILEHSRKDYWEETFKLFANIGNVRAFFAEVIRDLVGKKKYWISMNLWEAIIDEIVNEDAKKNIEKKLAQQILEILSEIPYEDVKYGDLILYLYPFYGLYNDNAILWKEQAWQLFHAAPHPFVQSIGTSILFRITDQTQQQLLYQLKKRLANFAQKDQPTSADCLTFLMKNNNNTLLLHLTIEKNILHLTFALKQLQTNNHFIILLNILNLRTLRELQYFKDFLNSEDGQQEFQEFQHLLKNTHFLKDFQFLKGIRGFLNLRKMRGLQDLRDLERLTDFMFVPVFRRVQDLRQLAAKRELLLRYSKNPLQGLQTSLSKYEQKYMLIIKKEQDAIVAWSIRALQELQDLSDKEVLKYFPDTSPEHLQRFRAGDYAYIEEVQ